MHQRERHRASSCEVTAPTVGRKKGGLEGRKPLYFSLNPVFSGPGVLLTPLASEGVWVVVRSTPGAA